MEIILEFVSPSLGGISSVPIAILSTFISFTNLRLAISTASTAVVMASCFNGDLFIFGSAESSYDA